MKIGAIMTRDVVTVTPGMTLRQAAAAMVEKGISGVVVVDDHGGVVGVLSEADILARERDRGERRGLLDPLFDVSDPRLEARIVAEAMSSPAITVSPTASLAEAAGRMLDCAVNRLPVVEDGKLVGIVARADLVRAFTRTDEEIVREIREDVIFRQLWMPPDQVNVTVRDGACPSAARSKPTPTPSSCGSSSSACQGVVSVQSTLSYRRRDPGRG